MPEKDPYQILGVSPSATDEEIREVYRWLAKEYHPDLHDDPKKKAYFEERFKELGVAYETLRDPQRRAACDAERGSNNGSSHSGYSPPPSSATTGPSYKPGTSVTLRFCTSLGASPSFISSVESDVSELYCIAESAADFLPTMSLMFVWKFEGHEVRRSSERPPHPTDIMINVIRNQGSLPVGDWQVVLLVDGILASKAGFSVIATTRRDTPVMAPPAATSNAVPRLPWHENLTWWQAILVTIVVLMAGPLLSLRDQRSSRGVEKVQSIPPEDPRVRIVTRRSNYKEQIILGAKKEITDALAPGHRRVKKRGRPGVREVTVEVSYQNGIEVSRRIINSRVVEPPLQEVALVGTAGGTFELGSNDMANENWFRNDPSSGHASPGEIWGVYERRHPSGPHKGRRAGTIKITRVTGKRVHYRLSSGTLPNEKVFQPDCGSLGSGFPGWGHGSFTLEGGSQAAVGEKWGIYELLTSKPSGWIKIMRIDGNEVQYRLISRTDQITVRADQVRRW